jgi:hypothetical protein
MMIDIANGCAKSWIYKSFWHNRLQCQSYQRHASGAAGSGSAADAVRRRLHALVSLLLVHYAHSRLHFPLQLVKKAPVRALREQLLRAGLDHAHLVQPQGVKAQGVFGMRLAPAVVREAPQHLDRHVVAPLVAFRDEHAGGLLGCLRAQVSRLQKGPQDPFRRTGYLVTNSRRAMSMQQ